MKHCVKHNLSLDVAKKAIDKATERYTEKFKKYDAKAEWTSDRHMDITFHVKGLNLKATLDVEPKQAVIDMEVPLLLRPFKGKALSVIDEVVQKWIAKAEQ